MKRSFSALFALCAALMLAAPAGCSDTTYIFEDVELGPDEDERTPRPRTNLQWLRSVYTDLLGRSPEAYDLILTVNGAEAARFPLDEQDQLLSFLDAVGDPAPMRGILTAALVRNVDANLPSKNDITDPAEFISEQFRKYLGRDPGLYELETFVDEWNDDPNVNPRTVVRALLGSREYQSY